MESKTEPIEIKFKKLPKSVRHYLFDNNIDLFEVYSFLRNKLIEESNSPHKEALAEHTGSILASITEAISERAYEKVKEGTELGRISKSLNKIVRILRSNSYLINNKELIEDIIESITKIQTMLITKNGG